MSKFNTIEEAIKDIQDGKIIVVVDDEDRENEGDLLMAAEFATPDAINFMATHGRGLICPPLTENRCKELELNMMVRNNTDPMETAFTVSVDLKGKGVTTGISASDRSKTVKSLVSRYTVVHGALPSCRAFSNVSSIILVNLQELCHHLLFHRSL